MSKTSLVTTEPVAAPPTPTHGAITPEFLRLPRPGQRCPYTGLTRSTANNLILPTEANGHKPPVKSICLRQHGAAKGCRLIVYESLRQYLYQHLEGGAR